MKINQLIEREAIKYMRYKDCFDSIDPKEIDLFRQEVMEGYKRIIETGFEFEFVDYEPYRNLEEMTQDVTANAVMKISKLNNSSRLLQTELNLEFRAVHDYFHYLLQQPFDFKGELNVYKATKFLHSTEIGKRILYSEVVLQAAYATHFGTFGPQKVII